MGEALALTLLLIWDRMQPPVCCFCRHNHAKGSTDRGYGAVSWKCLPAMRVFRVVDIAVKAPKHGPVRKSSNASLGMFEVHSSNQGGGAGGWRTWSWKRLNLTVRRPASRPQVVSTQVIHPHRFHTGAVIEPLSGAAACWCSGRDDAGARMRPAAYINYACKRSGGRRASIKS